ncbi:hypothetical protein VNO78_24003 [Psophocarpus tetragonolobus]|uniref:Uncharacterized protein n=1 Tax=Psophocarpus tetragonolobus TaxID=3891 RepID=A0AAN9S4M7_PSOTE
MVVTVGRDPNHILNLHAWPATDPGLRTRSKEPINNQGKTMLWRYLIDLIYACFEFDEIQHGNVGFQGKAEDGFRVTKPEGDSVVGFGGFDSHVKSLEPHPGVTLVVVSYLHHKLSPRSVLDSRFLARLRFLALLCGWKHEFQC